MRLDSEIERDVDTSRTPDRWRDWQNTGEMERRAEYWRDGKTDRTPVRWRDEQNNQFLNSID